jgi:hypothetical protein
MKENILEEFKKKYFKKFPDSDILIIRITNRLDNRNYKNQFVLVKNKYGICEVNKNNLLTGELPTIESAKNKENYLTNQIKERFPENLNIYSIIKYYKQSEIIVKTSYGLCKANSSALLKGCLPTIQSSINPTEYFINKSKKLFKDKFSYDNTIYLNAKKKINLYCNLHKKEFKTRPQNHFNINSKGCCPMCAKEKTFEHVTVNSPGWNKKDWFNSACKSKEFDSFKVYIIECWSEEERFYKIGRTFRKINRRFCSKKYLKYYYKVIEIIEFKELTKENSDKCYNLENELKRMNKENKYIPKLKFNGSSECFNLVKREGYA